MTARFRTRFIGIGNRYRSDDSLGPRVADALRERAGDWDIMEYGGDGATLIEYWDGFERIVMVDATSSGSPPGTIHRFDAVAEKIPSTFFNYSTHAFSVAEAIEVARRIHRLPDEMLLFGVEGMNFAPGFELSPVLAQVLPEIVSEIAAYIPAGAVRASRTE